MKRSEFEEISEKISFDEAMERLGEEKYVITTYESLKYFVINNIRDDENMLALHIWNAVYNSEGDSDWYYYDYSAGTTCTPVCLNDIDDVEQYIGFDEE